MGGDHHPVTLSQCCPGRRLDNQFPPPLFALSKKCFQKILAIPSRRLTSHQSCKGRQKIYLANYRRRDRRFYPPLPVGDKGDPGPRFKQAVFSAPKRPPRL